MADSAITKKALANSLKKLVCDLPFSKISISDICDQCEMNRKSFYYHFKDKYDLVNRIFDTEFSEYSKNADIGENTVSLLCAYLYKNSEYYKRIFRIEGQNSFRSHFFEFVQNLVVNTYNNSLSSTSDRLRVQFVTDGIVCAVERWMLDYDSMPPQQFSALLCSIIENNNIR